MENHESKLELIWIHPPGWCNSSTHSADMIRVGMVLFGVGFWFLREVINMQVVGGS